MNLTNILEYFQVVCLMLINLYLAAAAPAPGPAPDLGDRLRINAEGRVLITPDCSSILSQSLPECQVY